MASGLQRERERLIYIALEQAPGSLSAAALERQIMAPNRTTMIRWVAPLLRGGHVVREGRASNIRYALTRRWLTWQKVMP